MCQVWWNRFVILGLGVGSRGGRIHRVCSREGPSLLIEHSRRRAWFKVGADGP